MVFNLFKEEMIPISHKLQETERNTSSHLIRTNIMIHLILDKRPKSNRANVLIIIPGRKYCKKKMTIFILFSEHRK